MFNGLRAIHENAFLGCKELTKIVIPETVVFVGEGAFENCENLEIVKLNCKTKPHRRAFFNCPYLTIILPEGTSQKVIDSYKNYFIIGKDENGKNIYAPVKTKTTAQDSSKTRDNGLNAARKIMRKK